MSSVMKIFTSKTSLLDPSKCLAPSTTQWLAHTSEEKYEEKEPSQQGTEVILLTIIKTPIFNKNVIKK